MGHDEYQHVKDGPIYPNLYSGVTDQVTVEISTPLQNATKKGYTERELRQHAVANRDKFPDPTQHNAIMRVLIGISYAFGGLRRTFTEGYLLLSLYQSCIVSFFGVLWVMLSAAISLGLVEAAIALVGGRAGDWDTTKIVVYWTFVLILTFFWIIVLGLLFLPLIQAIISSESQKLSYVVEVRMNGLKWTARDVMCGQVDDGPACCSPAWFFQVFKCILDAILREFLMFLFRYVKSAVAIVCLQLLAILAAVIPGIGPLITTASTVFLFFLSIAYFFFDLVMMRKGLSTMASMRTVWNNLALLIGLGIGYLLLAPAIILIFPIGIISSTRLFVHLAAHGRTGREKTWWDVFFNYGLSFELGGVEFDTRENLQRRAEERLQILAAGTNGDGTPPTPVSYTTPLLGNNNHQDQAP